MIPLSIIVDKINMINHNLPHSVSCQETSDGIIGITARSGAAPLPAAQGTLESVGIIAVLDDLGFGVGLIVVLGQDWPR
jgi:hypothetical protein